MATTLFPTNVATPGSQAATNKPSPNFQGVAYSSLSFTRGSGVVSVGPLATAATLGNTNGATGIFQTINGEAATIQSGASNVENWTSGTTIFFITDPLAAVAIAGTITVNHRSLESAAQANYGAQAFVYRLPGYGPSAGLATCIGRGGNTTELGTTEAARSIAITPIATTQINDGDRIMVVFAYGSAGGTSTSTRTATFFYNGTTSAASGDSFVTFTETLVAAKKHREPAANMTHHPLLMEGMEQSKRNHLWLPKKFWRPRVWITPHYCPHERHRPVLV